MPAAWRHRRCWSHARRKFYEVAQATNAPIATEALGRIAKLYAIETDVRGQSPGHRLAARRNRSKPLVETMWLWFEQQLPLVPGRSTIAEAIRYALSRWDALTHFLHDGPIELDTNPVEQAIRPVALGRKNHRFAGSDGGGHRWAVLCSLIETYKLNDVEPYAYLHDVLSRLIDGHPIVLTNCCLGHGKAESCQRAERGAELERLPVFACSLVATLGHATTFESPRRSAISVIAPSSRRYMYEQVARLRDNGR